MKSNIECYDVLTYTGWSDSKIQLTVTNFDDWKKQLELWGFGKINCKRFGNDFSEPSFTIYPHESDGTYFVDAELIYGECYAFIIEDGKAYMNFLKDYIWANKENLPRFIKTEDGMFLNIYNIKYLIESSKRDTERKITLYNLQTDTGEYICQESPYEIYESFFDPLGISKE